jgi:hypothetical protein
MNEYKDCRNPVLPTHLHIPDPEAHVGQMEEYMSMVLGIKRRIFTVVKSIGAFPQKIWSIG